MSIDFTPLFRPVFKVRSNSAHKSASRPAESQRKVLRSLLERAKSTEFGRNHDFESLLKSPNIEKEFAAKVNLREYEDIREDVMRMVKGERDVLWPGVCRDYAQSSGTSGGRSKYVPITPDSLKNNHYRGAACSLAFYLDLVPESRIFSGKGFILGGSFASQLKVSDPRVKVGDLSATLINRINPLANLVRIPDKRTALMADWEKKLPALVKASSHADVTNISGVPSWFLTVIKRVLEARGASSLTEVWPNLEVFFHGGISFEPYRDEYAKLTDPKNMHFLETYNASEGFFAAQDDFSDHAMLLIVDADIYFEFLPLGSETALPITEIEVGKVYELVVTSSNGLWRYRLGDTIVVDSVSPVKIRIAGRTRSFINAFGEELMEDNAEKAMAEAARISGANILNYTAAPVFAEDRRRGRHQWLVEWETPPADMAQFAEVLDTELRSLNSDYDAKRDHTIFLDPPEIITAKPGLFDQWLRQAGNHKLGGQRKVPRLSNTRQLMDTLLEINE